MRLSLIDATVAKLQHVRNMVESGRLRGSAKIGVRAGKIINAHKVGKHFDLDITDDRQRECRGHLQDPRRRQNEARRITLEGAHRVRTSSSFEPSPSAIDSTKPWFIFMLRNAPPAVRPVA